jgi:tagatose-1,6-bisphosphate aldolase
VRFKGATEKQEWENVLKNMHDYSEMPTKRPLETKQNNEGKKVGSVYPNVLSTEPAFDDHNIMNSASAAFESIEVPALLEIATRPHRTNVVKWFKEHPRAIVLTADLTSSCEADLLRDTLPNQ